MVKERLHSCMQPSIHNQMQLTNSFRGLFNPMIYLKNLSTKMTKKMWQINKTALYKKNHKSQTLLLLNIL